MKRFCLTAAVTGAALALLWGCGGAAPAGTAPPDDSKLSVTASFYPMYDFAVKIGGDRVTVVNLVPAGTEPHSWEPSAADIVTLEQADVFVYNGAGMEHWTADVLASLENDSLIAVEASKGIPLLEGRPHGEGADHDGGGAEGADFDPHVWLDPMLARAEMENIKNALAGADPSNAAYYEANYMKYAAALDELDREFRDALSPLPGRDIVVAHEAFGYLCKAYGLNQVGIEGLSADSEPDPARMAEIIDFARANRVKVIFFEELVSPKVAEAIARAVNAQTAVLYPLGSLTDAQAAEGADYFTVMRQNLQALKAALG